MYKLVGRNEVSSNPSRICTETGTCGGIASENYLIKDYPRAYSGNGMPPSGLNPYQAVDGYPENNQYYQSIRDAVAVQPGSATRFYTQLSPSQGKYRQSLNTNYTPIPSYQNPKTRPNVNYTYTDGDYDISNVQNIQSPAVVEDAYINGMHFGFADGNNRFSPRNLNTADKNSIQNYFYRPRYPNRYGHLRYYQDNHAKRYNTANQNADIVSNSNDGKYYLNNRLPEGFVEWKGRIYRCDDLPPLDPKLGCLDPVYGSDIYGKCQAQSKYIFNSDKYYCNLDPCTSAQQPQAVQNNNAFCIPDKIDADKYGLLDNRRVDPAKCHVPTPELPDINFENYWQEWSYYDVPDLVPNY